MPQEKPKKKKKPAVRDSFPLSTSPRAIIAPAIGLRPMPTAVKGSGKGKEMSRKRKGSK